MFRITAMVNSFASCLTLPKVSSAAFMPMTTRQTPTQTRSGRAFFVNSFLKMTAAKRTNGQRAASRAWYRPLKSLILVIVGIGMKLPLPESWSASCSEMKNGSTKEKPGGLSVLSVPFPLTVYEVRTSHSPRTSP